MKTSNLLVYIDTVKRAYDFSSKDKKEEFRRELKGHYLRTYEKTIDKRIQRLLEVESLGVIPVEFTTTIVEARQLYMDGYFHSCIAMSGIAAETITHYLIDKMKVSGLKKKELHNISQEWRINILNVLKVIPDKIAKNLHVIRRKRNDYIHYYKKKNKLNPQRDALAVVNELTKIVEGTIAYKKFKEGKIVLEKE